MKKNVVRFVTLLACSLTASVAFADDGSGGVHGMSHFAAALAISVAAFGGALAQGRAASAALDGVARNPGASGKLLVPMILGLALIESLVIYALIVANGILGKA